MIILFQNFTRKTFYFLNNLYVLYVYGIVGNRLFLESGRHHETEGPMSTSEKQWSRFCE